MTIYLNNILVFSATVEQHLLDLRAVFEELRGDKLFVKHKKYFFGKMSVKYLKHIVKAGSWRMDPNKVEAIHTWPKPTMIKEL